VKGERFQQVQVLGHLVPVPHLRGGRPKSPAVMRNREKYLQIAAKVARKIWCHKSGSCRYAAKDITKALLDKGLSDFQVVEGYVRQPSGECGPRNQHVWILLGDGTKMDPTKIQFEKGTTYAGIKKKYSPAAYLIPHPKDAAFELQYPDYRQEFYKNNCNASAPTH
jgi:hypothetical protein